MSKKELLEADVHASLHSLPAVLRERLVFTKCSLTLAQDTTREEWQACVQRLGEVAGSVHWWIGDWLNFGKAKWGLTPRYKEAEHLTGLDYGTLFPLREFPLVLKTLEKHTTS